MLLGTPWCGAGRQLRWRSSPASSPSERTPLVTTLGQRGKWPSFSCVKIALPSHSPHLHGHADIQPYLPTLFPPPSPSMPLTQFPPHTPRRYSNLGIATFTEHDSGASATSPIVYTAAAGPGTVLFVGGAVLSGLDWSHAGTTFPLRTLKATVPGTIDVDSQDQLFVVDANGERHPLVRARTPNGKPWIPLDGNYCFWHGCLPSHPARLRCRRRRTPPNPILWLGFNLTAGQNYYGALNDVTVFSACYSPPHPIPGPTHRPTRGQTQRPDIASQPRTCRCSSRAYQADSLIPH